METSHRRHARDTIAPRSPRELVGIDPVGDSMIKRSLLAASMLLAAGYAHAGQLPMPTEEECGAKTNQRDMNICHSLRASAIEANMQAAYAELLERVKGLDAEAELRAAQAAWTAYRDADCLYAVGPSEMGGSVWGSLINSCREDHTEQRLETLMREVNCEQGWLGCGPVRRDPKP
jgi:uncharacterized protein YecT (DUF1311 family)